MIRSPLRSRRLLLTSVLISVSLIYLISSHSNSPELTTPKSSHDGLFPAPPRPPGQAIPPKRKSGGGEGLGGIGSWWGKPDTPPDPVISRGLIFDQDGTVKGWDKLVEYDKDRDGLSDGDQKILKGILGKHPIEVLIEKGLERWEGLLNRQSKSIYEAAQEYRRRYGMNPPRGFDKWWEYCQRNGVKILDDYDQIWHDIEPFYAISAQLFRKRAEALNGNEFSYHIHLSPTSASSLTGTREKETRVKAMFNLLEPIAQYLPSDLQLHFSDHDAGTWIVGDDQFQAAVEAISEGRYLSEEELKPFEKRVARKVVKGLASACGEDTPGWKVSLAKQNGEVILEQQHETSFVHDPKPGYDFCLTPSLLELHGALSFDYPRESVLRPIFQHSTFSNNREFLSTPLQAFENHTSSSAAKKTLPWEEKTDSRIFWRGSTTGDSYRSDKPTSWRLSHRPRLHLLAQEMQGEKPVWVKRHGVWSKENWAVGRLNKEYLDIGFAGKVTQCRKEDGTCDEMTEALVFKERVQPEVSSRYKYLLDVDGNGWSSRFHRLLVSGSVVIKSTIYPEWYSDRLIPWVHYIPTKIDYSDLYDIMSFFVGSPDGRIPGRDDLAKDISERARTFGVDFWRWEDMQAYMFRLLLEYGRLQADDRDAWIYLE